PTILGFGCAGTWGLTTNGADQHRRPRCVLADRIWWIASGATRSAAACRGAHGLWFATRLARPQVFLWQHAHARSDLRRYAVIAQHVAHVPRPAGLALHDEMPQGNACLGDQRCAQLAVFGGGRMAGVEFGQRSERCFKRASEPAERRHLLPAEL